MTLREEHDGAAAKAAALAAVLAKYPDAEREDADGRQIRANVPVQSWTRAVVCPDGSCTMVRFCDDSLPTIVHHREAFKASDLLDALLTVRGGREALERVLSVLPAESP